MNSPKLTNALLVALLVTNVLLFTGWAVSACHHRQGNKFAMHHEFDGRFHDSRSFHSCFGAGRSYHGGYCGGFRNRHHSGWNHYGNTFNSTN